MTLKNARNWKRDPFRRRRRLADPEYRKRLKRNALLNKACDTMEEVAMRNRRRLGLAVPE